MRYVNLFDFWFYKGQQYVRNRYASLNLPLKLILFYFYQVWCWEKVGNLQKFRSQRYKVFFGYINIFGFL